MKRDQQTIHLGYEVGTGEPVSIPLAHTFVTGQTQLSGKTTTLRAIVVRSNCRALAFVTKRGERFEGRRIAPFLPREGEQPIHWRLVETILASALGQRAMKYERYWLINASKGARSLADVRRNVDRLKAKAKNSTAEVYELIGEYIDLVLPEMRELDAADELDLQPGLNVMDLASISGQLQALVIRAALERINQHEQGVLTVFPEAWEFAPRSRAAPAKDEAIAMARKGSVLHNYLLCDSQDIAGVDTVVRQAASVWLIGVQREANELKRTLDVVRSSGVAAPKPSAGATLELGQFFVCYGRNAIKTYVQPTWMSDEEARAVAMGNADIPTPPPMKQQPEPKTEPILKERDAVTKEEAEELRERNRILENRVVELQEQIKELQRPRRSEASSSTVAPSSNGHVDADSLYETILARLLKEPKVMRLQTSKPELRVEETREVIEASSQTLRGRLAVLIHKGFFNDPATASAAHTELQRIGFSTAKPNVYKECDKLAEMGFLTKEANGYQVVSEMKVNVVKK